MSLVQLGSAGNSKTPIIGIDLGTTNSLVATVMNGEPMVLTTREGERMVPSVVSFENGNPVVGYAAKRRKVQAARQTLFSVKRLLGRGFSDVKEAAGKLPYRIVDGDKILRVETTDGRRFTAIEISAMILRELKLSAEQALGVPVTKAVITVPAYFNDSQRQATRAAGRIAGLEVLRILNEPTAASLAYGLGRKREGLIAVYDFGGGTFDVSILRLHDGIFEVLATNGDTALGGDDMDHAVAEAIAREKGLSLEQPETRARLLEVAEGLKIALSTSERAVAEGREWTRAEFERVITPVIERTREPCENALRDAGLEASELSDVVLVGGPTRLEAVKRMAREVFGREPNSGVNPDEVVALGAAVQADILAGNNKDFLLLDVVPLSLGIETYGGLMSVLIARNTRIPISATEEFTTFVDGQTAVDMHVLQGERERVEDNRSLARFKLKGLVPLPARAHRIEVNFMIDADGILQVAARDLRTGNEQVVEVRPSHGLTDAEIERMLVESAENAQEDVHFRLLVDARNHAEPLLLSVEKKLPAARRLLPVEDAELIEDLVSELRKAMMGTDAKEIGNLVAHLDHATRKLADLVIAEAIKEASACRE